MAPAAPSSLIDRRSIWRVGPESTWTTILPVVFIIVSLLWVIAYRFINPPITATMIGDIIAGREANREWMPIERIDRDMVRAVIAGEDSKYCTHDGFDRRAIEQAMDQVTIPGRPALNYVRGCSGFAGFAPGGEGRALAEAEEENGERLVFSDHHAVVFAPAASRSGGACASSTRCSSPAGSRPPPPARS